VNEFDLIDAFVAQFPRLPSPAGPGDDAAVLPASRRPGIVTTDAVVEGVHFTRRAFSWGDVGHKALAVNLSDVAAMGAEPTWMTVALGLPRDVGARELRPLGRGMAALARVHRVKLVGGNVTSADALSVTVTVAGELPGAPLLRSGGRPGDRLYLSGPVGDAAAGLEVLQAGERGRAVAALIAAQRRPAPHLAFARVARRFASAGLDVSDGLAQDLGHVCRASRVGADLEAAAIPLSAAASAWAGARALQLGLRGGEDYVLLVAVPPRRTAAFERALAKAGLAAHPIGALSATPGLRLDGHALHGPLGFQHRR
jgi:thiamine-monophosphate kinase